MKGKIGKGNQVERQIRRTKNAKKKNELEILEYLQEPNCPIVSDLLILCHYYLDPLILYQEMQHLRHQNEDLKQNLREENKFG